jgi:rhamnosyltransferase
MTSISIVIPTLNGMATLPEVFEALAAQDVAAEVVVVDSGSSDGTTDYARSRGAGVVEIPRESFNHGVTRNVGIAQTTGSLVVLIVQDAAPASSGWLRALTSPFETDPAVAGTFARQIPRPGASALTRWSVRDWIAARETPRTSGPLTPREYEALTPSQRHDLCVFDNVCACIRRDVWLRHPFRAAPIAEDLEWGREVLLAGYRIAYAPEAAVRHSHDRGVAHEWRRTRDVHRRLFELFGLSTIPSRRALVRSICSTVPAHLRVAARDRSPNALVRALALAIAWPVAQYSATRHARPRFTSTTHHAPVAPVSPVAPVAPTRILLLVHGFPPSSCGGTETYVADLAQALSRRPGLGVSVLAREGDPLRAELAVRRERRGLVDVHFINNTFQTCESFEDSYRNPALGRVAASVIDAIDPDVVHVQHLTALSTDLVEECRRRGTPVVMTLNDYWMICHRGQLIDRDGKRCDGPGCGPQAEAGSGCARCIPPAALAPAAAWRAGRRLRRIPIARTAVAIAERAMGAMAGPERTRAASLARACHMREVCRAADLLLAPSRTLEARHLEFGVPRDRLRWCDQGIHVGVEARSSNRAPRPLRLAFAGSLMYSKAPHVLLDAVERLPPGSATVDLIGAVAPYHGSVEYARALSARLGAPFIRHLGHVPHERMPELLAAVDVLVVPSVWIENAPFVIREAFAAGVPIVASRLGGMAEMVRDGVDGLLFEAGNADALADVLRRILDEPDLLPSLRAGIRRVMTIDEDAAQLVETYTRLRPDTATASPPRRPAPRDLPPEGGRHSISASIAAVVLNYRTSSETWLAVRSIQSAVPAVGRIIIVDNGSDDESERELRDSLAGVEVLQTGTNAGFSAGVNAGIRRALDEGAGAALLVNSDVILPPDTIGVLAQALACDPRIGIAAPVVLSRAEPDVIASAGIRFFASTGRMRHRAAGHRLSSARAAGIHLVEAVSGCAMLVRREVFDAIGFFDEACFFSFEDVDFCLRARTAGYDTVCVAAAVAYHEGGATMGKRTPRRVYYGVRNHLRVAARNAPRGAFASASRAAAIVAFNVAYVARSPDVPLFPGLAAVGRGAVDHLRGRYGA